jgi:putative membrane protein
VSPSVGWRRTGDENATELGRTFFPPTRTNESMDESEPHGDRENLALVRTDLANERTFLAYSRTALIVVGSGVSLIEVLVVPPIWIAIGWMLAVIGTIVGIVGAIRFVRLHARLHPRS